MTNYIIALIFALFTALFIFFGIRQLKEKGLLLNKAYLYASKEEKETMNKKPYYRQSGIVFLGLGISFFIFSIDVMLGVEFLFWIGMAFEIGTLIYAVISQAKINKKNKRG